MKFYYNELSKIIAERDFDNNLKKGVDTYNRYIYFKIDPVELEIKSNNHVLDVINCMAKSHINRLNSFHEKFNIKLDKKYFYGIYDDEVGEIIITSSRVSTTSHLIDLHSFMIATDWHRSGIFSDEQLDFQIIASQYNDHITHKFIDDFVKRAIESKEKILNVDDLIAETLKELKKELK